MRFLKVCLGALLGGLLLASCQTKDPASSAYLRWDSETPILVFGDSLSFGYGVDEKQVWVVLLEQKLIETGYMRSNQRVANYSKSGETSEGGMERFAEALDDTHPYVVVLELGSNDALRRQSMQSMRGNLERMIAMATERHIRVVLVGTDLPAKFFFINTDGFTSIYKELAEEHAGVILVPNLLDGVNSKSSLMQDDGIHPNELGQPRMLENIWDAILEASEQS